MTQTIQLTREQVTIVDEDDYQELSQFKWLAQVNNRGYYACRFAGPAGARVEVYMHRVIMGAPDDILVDHINGNTLDNRKENLRLCTRSQNGFNRGCNKNGTSGYKGVTYCKNRVSDNWKAQIKIDYKNHHLGYFHTPKEAYDAYCIAAKQLHGKFAKLV